MIKEMLTRIKQAIKIVLNGTGSNSVIRKELPHISNEEVEEAKSFFPLPKFFVYGHARSGTTLLARMLRLHPDVHCGYQAHFFTKDEYLKQMFTSKNTEIWLNKNSNHWNRKRDLTPVLMRSIIDFIMERDGKKEGAKVVGDKSTNSILNGEAVSNTYGIYPDAKIVYIIRDGRDTLLSHRFQRFVDRPNFISNKENKIYKEFENNPEPFFLGSKSLFSQNTLEGAARNWVDNVESTIEEMEKLYPENNYIIRYEDLLKNPVEEMKKLWNFLGVSKTFPEAESLIMGERNTNHSIEWQLHKSPKMAKNLIRLKEGNWSDLFTENDTQTFNSIAGDTLKKWNYN